MSIQPEQPDVTEELSAYLDGELTPSERSRIEQRLGQDAAYREELQRLERAWDLLDRLPRADVGEAFTRTTIEMVAVAASEDLATALAAEPKRRRRQWLVAAGFLVAASAGGLVIGRTLWPDPNRKLLEDLPVIENFEQYHQADSVDFLRKLQTEKLFPEETDHAS
jgi:hypothetical protein